MNTNPLEQRIRDLPEHALPDKWREEILRAAESAAGSSAPVCTVNAAPWWRAWLWPCPQAWAGVAAAWCVILVLNLGAARTEGKLAGHDAPPPVPMQVWAAFAAQRDLRTDLELPPDPLPKSAPPAIAPPPRSSRSRETFMV
jgi:hypothetical protein